MSWWRVVLVVCLAAAGCGGGEGGESEVVGEWRATTIAGAPDGRSRHTAVWTGTEMIVWGGEGQSVLAAGGRYELAADRWLAVSTVDEPSPRHAHTAIWTGEEMIVWGGTAAVTPGVFETAASGGLYDPARDEWRPTTLENAPVGRTLHVAVWTGEEMIIWGGARSEGGALVALSDGARYRPDTDSWQPMTSEGAPQPTWTYTAVWSGSEMIVWTIALTEDGLGIVPAGARYSPASDTWTPIAATAAPTAIAHDAVWSGSEMIVFGFTDPRRTAAGRYDPSSDSWSPVTLDGVPPPSHERAVVQAGTQMIVWGGGSLDSEGPDDLRTGGVYDPLTDSWADTAIPPGFLSPRRGHRAVWTGEETIIWGGSDQTGYPRTGATLHL